MTRSQEKRLAAIARAERKVLATANARFEIYLETDGHADEESVLAEVNGDTEAKRLIRAIALLRIAKRPAPRKRK